MKKSNYVDKEWLDACNSNEKEVYYFCEMQNFGWCIKYYKPSVALLTFKRGMYRTVAPIRSTH